MSGVSSDNLPSSDEEPDRPLPPVYYTLPAFPERGPDPVLFSRIHPPASLDGLTQQQLEDRLGWATESAQQLRRTLDELRSVLASEWFAKEKILDELLIKELDQPRLLLLSS